MNAFRPLENLDSGLSNIRNLGNDGIRNFTSDLNSIGSRAFDVLRHGPGGGNGFPLPELDIFDQGFGGRGMMRFGFGSEARAADIYHSVYNPNATPRDRIAGLQWSAVPRDSDLPRYLAPSERTPYEMAGLLKHLYRDIDNRGVKGDKITSDEIYAYLGKNPGLDNKVKEDLNNIAQHLHAIGGKDGKISQDDLDKFMMRNRYHHDVSMYIREAERNQPQQPGGQRTDQPVRDVPRIGEVSKEELRNREGRANYFEMSQDNFKAKWGEALSKHGLQNVDLTKFMPGKANDGICPPTEFDVTLSGGMGGTMSGPGWDERPWAERLKWNQPDRHDLKYDFGRNFAQVFKVLQSLPTEELQIEFTQDFLRTQAEVFTRNGYQPTRIENEKIFTIDMKTGRDAGFTDVVQDIGGRKPLIQW